MVERPNPVDADQDFVPSFFLRGLAREVEYIMDMFSPDFEF